MTTYRPDQSLSPRRSAAPDTRRVPWGYVRTERRGRVDVRTLRDREPDWEILFVLVVRSSYDPIKEGKSTRPGLRVVSLRRES